MTKLDYKFISEIKELPFVKAVYLYGSRARGDNVPRSDIDLAVDCGGASYADWHKVMDIVEEADTLLEVDCVRLDDLSDSSLKKAIERDKVQL